MKLVRICPACDSAIPDGAVVCLACAASVAPAHDDTDTIAPAETTHPSGSARPEPRPPATAHGVVRPVMEFPAALAERFDVIRLLGSGGMGAVFLARDRKLAREVAVKLIRDRNALRERLLAEEARALASLEDENIVRLYELGSVDEMPYLVMEYVRGVTLSRHLEMERPLIIDAVRIVADILRGAHAAHQRGIVHRDLKPANVFVTSAGRVKIADFGLARTVLQTPHPGDATTMNASGTPGYMAPEQGRGENDGPAVDVYAIGVIFHEMLTGRRLYAGPSHQDLLERQRTGRPPPPSRLNSTVPPALDDIVVRALSPLPGDRPQAGDLAIQLDAWIARATRTSAAAVSSSEGDLAQLRLMLEEICCDLCRFDMVNNCGVAPDTTRVDREVYLGTPRTFADIRVGGAGVSPYFVEQKHGCADDLLVSKMARKYGPASTADPAASKLVLVVDVAHRPDWPRTRARIEAVLRPGFALEVWDESVLFAKVREAFGLDVSHISPESLLDVSRTIERFKTIYAFGRAAGLDHQYDALRAQLIWHMGFWRIHKLREQRGSSPRDLLPPGVYRNVAAVRAGLCGFTSFVRDTRDDDVTQQMLTSFYSKARYAILNHGGLLYQIVDNEVIGLFGLPDQPEGYVARALDAATSLVNIGDSVMDDWQSQIDRIQPIRGLHVGIASGDLQLIPMRPYSRTHLSAVGDPLNVAAHLKEAAGPSDIILSKSFHRTLDPTTRARFEPMEIQAQLLGHLGAYRLTRP